MSTKWMNQKVNELPTVKPGKQFITISNIEDKSDEKGNRILVTFTVENGATFNKMFFEQSIVADNIADRDKDYNNMLAQLGTKDTSIANVLKVGNRYYANVGYGVNSQGYTVCYPNITNYIPQASEDMTF